MPDVQIQMFTGRTLDQKRDMVKKVTDAICDAIKCPPEVVHISITEISKENVAKAGKLMSES